MRRSSYRATKPVPSGQSNPPVTFGLPVVFWAGWLAFIKGRAWKHETRTCRQNVPVGGWSGQGRLSLVAPYVATNGAQGARGRCRKGGPWRRRRINMHGRAVSYVPNRFPPSDKLCLEIHYPRRQGCVMATFYGEWPSSSVQRKLSIPSAIVHSPGPKSISVLHVSKSLATVHVAEKDTCLHSSGQNE
jgi:hypothetical protein